jgi:hypothetical protein
MSSPEIREVILDYSCGLNVVTKVLKSIRGRQRRRLEGYDMRACSFVTGFVDKEAEGQGRWVPWENGKGKEREPSLETP